jgi:signal transduction histidine kinase
MTDVPRTLTTKYVTALRSYLAGGGEAILHQAYDLARQAMAEGCGVLDLARIHHQALVTVVLPGLSASGKSRTLKKAEVFLLEILSPFEVTHRGFRQTNLKLHELIQTLEQRHAELADANRELQSEIVERKRTEAALRESEEHLRELFEEAKRMHENLQNLSRRVLQVQEEERKRISRELHDEIGQVLTAISVNLAMLKKDSDVSRNGRDQKLADTQALLEQMIETVHRFARELRPAMLDDLGLLPALRSYTRGFTKRTGVRVRFNASQAVEDLDSDRKTVVYRIAQESLTNVAKHARAKRVEVTVRKLRNGIRMEIKDDGDGFQVHQQIPANGEKRLGLLGMQERVRLVNGDFTVVSKPGKGTTIRVGIPLQTN